MLVVKSEDEEVRVANTLDDVELLELNGLARTARDLPRFDTVSRLHLTPLDVHFAANFPQDHLCNIQQDVNV